MNVPDTYDNKMAKELLRWTDERLVRDQGNLEQNGSMKVPVVAAQPLVSKQPQQTPLSQYIRAGRCRLANTSNTTREGKASPSTFNAAVSLMVQCLKGYTPDRRCEAGVESKQVYGNRMQPEIILKRTTQLGIHNLQRAPGSIKYYNHRHDTW